jgi:hypothetical protein
MEREKMKIEVKVDIGDWSWLLGMFKLGEEFRTGLAPHYPIIYSLVRGLEARNVFEFGSGPSTDVILEALKLTGGKLTSVATKSDRDRSNNPQFTFHEMLSSQALPLVKDQLFDLVLHDGSHSYETVLFDLQTIIPQIKRFGLLLVHDTQHSYYVPGMPLALRFVLRDIKCSFTTLPFAYGLTIVRIEGNEQNGDIRITRGKPGALGTTRPFTIDREWRL